MTDAERDEMLGKIMRAVNELAADLGLRLGQLDRRVTALETATPEAAALYQQVIASLQRAEEKTDRRLLELDGELRESRVRHSERARYDSNHDLAQDAQIRDLLVALAAANERNAILLERVSQVEGEVKTALTPQDQRKVGLLGAGSGAGGAGAVIALFEYLPRAIAWVRSLFD